jgi:hypothetical protein
MAQERPDSQMEGKLLQKPEEGFKRTYKVSSPPHSGGSFIFLYIPKRDSFPERSPLTFTLSIFSHYSSIKTYLNIGVPIVKGPAAC